MEPKFHQRTALTWFSPRHPHLASTIMERYHRPLPWPPCDEANKEWARGAPLAQGPNYAHPLCQPDRLRSRTPATLTLAPGLGGQGNLVPKGTGAVPKALHHQDPAPSGLPLVLNQQPTSRPLSFSWDIRSLSKAPVLARGASKIPAFGAVSFKIIRDIACLPRPPGPVADAINVCVFIISTNSLKDQPLFQGPATRPGALGARH